MTAPTLSSIELGDLRLRAAIWGSGPVGIVMLHDGLGSIPQWRDTPAEIAEATGTAVMAYERAGHGQSLPHPTAAWPFDWLHREAVVLADLLVAMAIDEPLLVGHSDGGSVALLHAASGATCSGLIALAAHSWVETVCIDAILRMRQNPDRFITALAPHHDAPAALFDAWSGVWTSAEFSRWDIRPQLGAIHVPVLVVQGTNDRYATDNQLTETAAAIGANAQIEHLANTGHIIHHEQPAAVTSLVSNFYDHIQHQGN